MFAASIADVYSPGDGDYCEDGLKFYCCEIPNPKEFNCHWSGIIISSLDNHNSER